MDDTLIVPKHIAIVMDGNGRWAKERFLPRVEGHRRGLGSVRAMIAACLKHGIPNLTLFAFSSENWRRPQKEVSFLFSLLSRVLKEEVAELNSNGVLLNIIGERSALDPDLAKAIAAAETLTQHNTALRLNLAINFGGQWDIFQAAKKMTEQVVHGEKNLVDLQIEDFKAGLSLASIPEPDLFIRTSGIYRLSNFLLWDLAYTELYFSPVMWPDFREEHLLEALKSFSHRERRFGYTGEQLEAAIST